MPEEEIKKSCKYANGQCLYDGNCPPFEGEFIWCRYLRKEAKPKGDVNGR